MKIFVNTIWLSLVIGVPAFGWERVCTFSFRKSYDGVRVEQVKVYREKDKETGAWVFGVGVSGVSVKGPKCPEGQILTAYVSTKVTSSGGGFLDTGDLKARGDKPQSYWKLFDRAYIADCAQGARLWTTRTCEKAK